MTMLHQALFRHVLPLEADAAPLPHGGALFSTRGFDRFLEGRLVPPEPTGVSPFGGPPAWAVLRSYWGQVLPLERTSFDGWRASLQAFGNLDWSGLNGLDIDI